MRLSFLLLSAWALLVNAAPHAARQGSFSPGADTYPHASSLGAAVEGVSVNCQGAIHAVNTTHFIDITTGEVKYTNSEKETHLASSRFTRFGFTLVGDAGAHKVRAVAPGGDISLYENPGFLQPNDMSLSVDHRNIYLSGMNWTVNTGELWYSINGNKPVSVNVQRAGLFRTNGIEISMDGKQLFLTSGENGEAGSMASAKIYAFKLLKGVPQLPPTVAFDLGGKFPELLKAGMDPDGMRADMGGNVWNTLNAVGKVLRWNPYDVTDYTLYELPTVAYPSNLELGGKDGKTVVVLGRCKTKDGKISAEVTESCADMLVTENAGRAWSELQQKTKDW